MAIKSRETQSNLERGKGTVEPQLKETYRGLPIPFVNQFEDTKTPQREIGDIGGGNDSITTRVFRKMFQGEQIITKWAPVLLWVCLDELLWRDSNNIQVKKLWEYFSACCDLPRLLSNMVLGEAACQGFASEEYYDIAVVYSEDKDHYIDPKSNQAVFGFNQSDYLVKLGIVLGQRREEEKECEAVNNGGIPLSMAIVEGGR